MMLAPNAEYMRSKTPRELHREALCEAAEGVTKLATCPLRPEAAKPVMRGRTRDGGKEGPMWRGVLIPA